MPLRCHICNVEFQRTDHLSRHLARHQGVRPFSCHICNAAFARRDALRRHLSAHAGDSERGRKSRVGARACTSCAQSKKRCEGNQPCSRCREKGFRCEFPVHQRQSSTLSILNCGLDGTQVDLDLHNSLNDRTWPTQNPYLSPQFADPARSSSLVDQYLDPHVKSAGMTSAQYVERCQTPVRTIQETHSPSRPTPRNQQVLNHRELHRGTITTSNVPFDDEENSRGTDQSGLDNMVGSGSTDLATLNTQLLQYEQLAVSTQAFLNDEFNSYNMIDPPMSNGEVEEMCFPGAEATSLDSSVSPNVIGGYFHGIPRANIISALTRKQYGNQGDLINNILLSHGSDRSNDFAQARIVEQDHPIALAVNRIRSSLHDSRKGVSNPDLEDYRHVPFLPRDTYLFIQQVFRTVNAEGGPYLPFTQSQLMSREDCNAFMQTYFEEFHGIFPLIHKPTFDAAPRNWLVTLATIAVGMSFSRLVANYEKGRKVSEIIWMQEFLRRAVQYAVPRETGTTSILRHTQAAILNQIGMMFSGDMELTEHAHVNMSFIATIARKQDLFADINVYEQAAVTETDISNHWSIFIQQEERRRAAYFAWFIDCQHSLLFDLPAVIPPDLLRAPLPCQDIVWEAVSPETWKFGLDQSFFPQALHSELEILRQTLQPPKTLSHFNLAMLMLSIYCDKTIQPRFALGLLDILRSGFGHNIWPREDRATIPNADHERFRLTTIVLELNHMICISLLVPIGILLTYRGWHVTPKEASRNTERLRSWFAVRPEEARRAVWHASQTLSLIERYPTKGQHEGMALVMATTVLLSWIDYHHPAANTTVDAPEDTLRLDKATNTVEGICNGNKDCALLARWFQDVELQVRLFLPGIGSLLEIGASTRLLKHTVKILEERKDWTLNKPIALTLFEQFTYYKD